MDFRLTAVQQDLRRAARELSSREITSARVRACFDAPIPTDRSLHQAMADLGWLAIMAPEERGGLGLGVVELAVVAEQVGYVNAPVPFVWSAALVVPALVSLQAWPELDDVISGRVLPGVVLPDGTVVGAAGADRLLDLSGPTAWWIETTTTALVAGLTTDPLRPVSRLADIPTGRQLGDTVTAEQAVEVARAALCAEMVGAMQWVLDTTVAHVRTRTQFNRPIGSYQAVAHACADMLLRTESSRAATYRAAYGCDAERSEARLHVSVAKAICSDSFDLVARHGVQLHGAMGITWEHDLHLYYKRSMQCRGLLGDPAWHRERVLDATLSATAPIR